MHTPRGMSLIDVVVGTGVMLVVFLSIFGAYKIAIDLVLNTKARVGGMSLVSQELEYLRGLPYESLGTIGGIPSGTIPQVSTSTLNGIAYTKRVLIRYVDDPADGLGAADSNGIEADYKELKVEESWSVHERIYKTFAVTRVAPHGIESLTSGGTLRVNVFDALVQAVAGATVHITNASTSPAVDITVMSDAQGTVAFPGAPPASNYKIVVTKDGYSSAQTHDITSSNPNPNPGHVSVANQQSTTVSFAIDRLGSLNVRTYSPIDVGAFQDTFANDTNLAATSSADVAGGALTLVDQGSGYALTGDARSDGVQPAELVSWDLVSWQSVVPTDTTLTVQVVYPSGGDWVPVPDGVVSGNSAGLTSGSVSLGAVATSTFPTLALKALLATNDASTTPELLDWSIDYHAGPSPLPNVTFALYGTKTIGTSISGSPIYKVVQSLTTSSAGEWLITPLEWDTYTIQLSGSQYDTEEQCPSPLSVEPDVDAEVALYLVPHSTNSLRVEVTGNTVPLSGATVTLTSPGNETHTSSSCGQAFFPGLTVDTYTLTVTHPNYQPLAQDISIAGTTVVSVPLTP